MNEATSPSRLTADHLLQLSIDPELALVFPGQGSQKVGMGRAAAESSTTAAGVFAEADEALGFGLSRLCFEGPEERLRETANTQPAATFRTTNHSWCLSIPTTCSVPASI